MCMCVRICLCVVRWFYDQPLFDGPLNRFFFFHFHRLDALNYNVNTNLWLQISYAFIALQLIHLFCVLFILSLHSTAKLLDNSLLWFCLKSIRIFKLLCNFIIFPICWWWCSAQLFSLYTHVQAYPSSLPHILVLMAQYLILQNSDKKQQQHIQTPTAYLVDSLLCYRMYAGRQAGSMDAL